MTVRVKICGITNTTDARHAFCAGAAAIGLNFVRSSPRYVTPETAAEIVAAVPSLCCVGVFVNETRATVREIAAAVGIQCLQFHGDEDPAYCEGWSLPIVKAIRVRDRATIDDARAYPVDYILADAYSPEVYGGSGRSFAWNLLEPLDKDRLILAGGLHPENVAAAVRAVRPYAVDVASGVESEPGRKDPKKVERFIAHATNA